MLKLKHKSARLCFYFSLWEKTVSYSSAVQCMSPQQEKPKAIDPLDYEAVISKLGDELKEDPLRDLLLFPDNDFLVSVWDFVGGSH